MKIVKTTVKKAEEMIFDIKKYWQKPREGQYVSNKEFAGFVLGAGTSNCASYAAGNLTFSAGCMFVGAIYGLKMMDFAMLGFVGLILSYLFSPIGMIITDNLGSPPKKTMRFINLASLAFTIVGIACFFVPQELFEGFMPGLPQVIGSKFLLQVFSTYWNSFVLRKFSPKFGKYRSWIIAGILPFMASMMLLLLFPYNSLPYYQKFWVMHLLFSLWGCFSSCFGQVTNIQNVISPSTTERTKIMSIGSFLHSLFPSIYNIIFPVFATLAGGMTDIKTYKIVIPVMIAVFAPFSLFLVFGVKDRVIQSQEHKPQIDMKKGFKEVLRNKYLWITSISGWVSTTSAGLINLINIMIIYSLRQDWVIGIVATILGTAWTPGMLLAPILIKKLGKKKIVLIGKYFSVFCTILTVGGVFLNSLVLVVLSSYLSTLLASATAIAVQGINADIWDYQQYISGERLDGCMGIFGYLSAPLTTAAGLLVPFLYGLVGFTSDWNILYNPELRTKIFFITLAVGAVAGLLGLLPFHFYDFTEKRHEEIMVELKQRADEEHGSDGLAQVTES